jgi:hypothetical protein
MKLPLQVQAQWICDADGNDMLLMDTCTGADMQEIVRRVNAYDAMKAACEAALNHMYMDKSGLCDDKEVALLKAALELTEANNDLTRT